MKTLWLLAAVLFVGAPAVAGTTYTQTVSVPAGKSVSVLPDVKAYFVSAKVDSGGCVNLSGVVTTRAKRVCPGKSLAVWVWSLTRSRGASPHVAGAITFSNPGPALVRVTVTERRQ